MKHRSQFLVAIFMALTVVFTGCIPLGIITKIPGIGGQPEKVVPEPGKFADVDGIPIFGWHARTAFLDARGGGGAPVGIQALRSINVTHVGVPHSNSGQFPDGRHFINDIHDSLGAKVIRTLPNLYALSGGQVDLGKWILEWESPTNSGEFIQSIVDAMHSPIDGIGFDVEEDPTGERKYPFTRSDQKLADQRGIRLRSQDDLLRFRSDQITEVTRAILASMQQEFLNCKIAIIYGAYPRDKHTNKDGDKYNTREYYGLDWEKLFDPSLSLNGHRLPVPTHGMPMYPGPVIPNKMVDWARDFEYPLLFNVQTYVPAGENREEFYTTKIEQLLAMVNVERGDGLSFVDEKPPPPPGEEDKQQPQFWDTEDKGLLDLLGRLLRKHGIL